MAEKTDHYKLATAALERADEWMDIDYGWRGELSQAERLEYRAADLAEAQVHATLALVEASRRPQIVRMDAP